MGQDFTPVIKREGTDDYNAYSTKIGRIWWGRKLTECSWYINMLPNAIAEKIYKKPSRVAWIGDSVAEDDVPDKKIIETVDKKEWLKLRKTWFSLNMVALVNHDKKEIIKGWTYLRANVESAGAVMHPLSLLTAMGNKSGGSGNYRGTCEDYVGSWAWDVIESTDDWKKVNDLIRDKEYKEICPIFTERRS